MKKTLILFLLLLTLGTGILPALAVPVTELNDLARYFPSDTVVFVATRSDDAYLESLDSLVLRIADALPAGAVPAGTVTEALDEALGRADPPLDFQEDIRPWLGDTAALGVLEIPVQDGSATRFMEERQLDEDAPMLIALAITDREAATEFFENAMSRDPDLEVTRTDEADFTLIETSDPAALIVRDDVLLITNMPDQIAPGGVPDDSLSSQADFAETFALLPETDYNLSVYINLPEFISEAAMGDPDFAEIEGLLGGVFDAVGPQAWGGTILDESSLVLDVVQRLTDASAFETLGIPLSGQAPVDPAFLAHVPAGAPLVIHSTDLNRAIETFVTSMQRQAELLSESETDDVDSMQQAEESLELVLEGFTDLTGLDLQEDVLGWMTGDFALFVMLSADLNVNSPFGFLAAMPVDFGIAIEATDPAAAAATVEGLTEALEQVIAARQAQQEAEIVDEAQAETPAAQSQRTTEVAVSTETIGGTEVTVITFTGPSAPWPVELVLGANDEVFALGTRSAAQAIFARDGGLASSPTFQQAQTYFLENSVSVAYLGPQGLLPLTDLLMTFAEQSEDDSAAQAAESIRAVLELISSATVSQSQDASGNSFSRLVLSLALSE